MVNSVNTNPAMLWHSVNGQASKSQTANTAFGQSVSHGSHAGQLDGDALISGSIRMHGGSWLTASVFKADDFSANNPIMRVVGTDTDGTPFEEFININNVDPRSASFIELFALDGYNAANGNPTKIASSAAAGLQSQNIANGGCGVNWGEAISAFTRLNMLAPVIHLMQLQQQHGNFDAFMHLQNITDAMNRHISRIGG